MSENVIQFSSLTVTPHSAYIPEYAFNNNFSFNQATNIICNAFMQNKTKNAQFVERKIAQHLKMNVNLT